MNKERVEELLEAQFEWNENYQNSKGLPDFIMQIGYTNILILKELKEIKCLLLRKKK